MIGRLCALAENQQGKVKMVHNFVPRCPMQMWNIYLESMFEAAPRDIEGPLVSYLITHLFPKYPLIGVKQ